MKAILLNVSLLDYVSVFSVMRRMQKTGIRNVFINSNGGSMDVFFAAKNPLIDKSCFIGGQQVDYLAIPFLLLGRRRFCLPESEFKFHQCYANYDGRMVSFGEAQMLFTIEKNFSITDEASCKRRMFLLEQCRVLAFTDYAYSDFIASRTGMSRGRVFSLMRDEVTMSSAEARQNGLVDEIITKRELRFV